MPVHECELPGGGKGYKWGGSGKCYASRAQAERQAAAAYAHGYTGDFGGARIDATHDVPYGGGTSTDGRTVYIDKRIPRWMGEDGSFIDEAEARRRFAMDEPVLDVHQAIATHESAEFEAMTAGGDSYATAHTDHANPAEKAYVEGQGLAWDTYDKAVEAFVRGIEHSQNPELPPNLYLKPYGAGCRPCKGDPEMTDLHREAQQAGDCIALDRASARLKDQDGHLHVEGSAISKANVCPYWGREIPGADALGLQPDRVYYLLRDPAALQRAAASFDGKPLLARHKAVSADDHDHELTVGAVMNPYWDAPYLKAELVVWDGDLIKAIEDGDQKELSCGYRYRAEMTPGLYDGVQYDGRMVDIVGNHVALVTEGRAGPDVVVGDTKMEASPMAGKNKLSARAAMVKGALTAYLYPRLAADAQIDYAPILAQLGNERKMIGAVTTACKGKLAKDAKLDDLPALMVALDEMEEEVEDSDETEAEMKKKEKDGEDADETEEEKAERMKKAEGAEDAAPVTRADLNAAVAKARRESAVQMQAMTQALDEVRPYVGRVAAQDSAEGVYKAALDMLGIDTKGVHASAYRAILQAQRKPAEALAQDMAPSKDFGAKFGDVLSRINFHA